jgi:hypothetical protein
MTAGLLAVFVTFCSAQECHEVRVTDYMAPMACMMHLAHPGTQAAAAQRMRPFETVRTAACRPGEAM